MLFLIAGLGSIGQRHVRNLHSILGADAQFIAFRQRGLKSALSELGPSADNVEQVYGIRSFTNLDDALAERPHAAFICNPSSLHVPVALAAARSGCHLFIEKPVSNTQDGLAELGSLIREKDLKVMVGFQYRLHPGLAAVKNLVEQGALGYVCSVQVHWGEYLPGWHPWEDHRDSYSARRNLGGGVLLTLCHPFDYLRWIFGEVRSVYATIGNLGSLDIEAEDTADVLLQFSSGVLGTVHLNYIQRPPRHSLEIIGSSGTALWDNESGCVEVYQSAHGGWQRISLPTDFVRNDLFVGEVRHFLQCLSQRLEPIVSLEDGVRALEVVLAAKRAATEGRRILLSDEKRQ